MDKKIKDRLLRWLGDRETEESAKKDGVPFLFMELYDRLYYGKFTLEEFKSFLKMEINKPEVDKSLVNTHKEILKKIEDEKKYKTKN